MSVDQPAIERPGSLTRTRERAPAVPTRRRAPFPISLPICPPGSIHAPWSLCHSERYPVGMPACRLRAVAGPEEMSLLTQSSGRLAPIRKVSPGASPEDGPVRMRRGPSDKQRLPVNTPWELGESLFSDGGAGPLNLGGVRSEEAKILRPSLRIGPVPGRL